MGLTSFKNIGLRRGFIEKKLRIKLPKIKQALVDDELDINCENLIGGVSIPLGVAGPLRIKEKNKDKDYYIPLATTEGALIASVNRGCKAITMSKGVETFVEDVGVTRGVIFEAPTSEEITRLKIWFKNNFQLLKRIAEKTSSHLKFKNLDFKTIGLYLYVRFYFDTDKAMGMNMVTIAVDSIVQTIELKTKVRCLSIAGNFDIDKKPAWLNFIKGRGKTVQAEVVLSEKVVKTVLKTKAEKIFNVWLAKCMIGSAISGSIGFNAHFANVISALYVATGQDIGHVVEGSLGITTVKLLPKNNLYISVYLPAIMIGTVGGGTKYKTQKESLEILQVKDSYQLAKIVAGTVLAGEISLLASLAEGSLAKAHQRLARNKIK